MAKRKRNATTRGTRDTQRKANGDDTRDADSARDADNARNATLADYATMQTDALRALHAIVNDPTAQAAARAQAARLILEATGALGKFQDDPRDTARKRVEEMSLEEIDAELIRLRRAAADTQRLHAHPMTPAGASAASASASADADPFA